MLKNYLIVAFRNIKRHKASSFINIMGLSLGIASFILIMLFVLNEWKYDTFYKKADRLFRISFVESARTAPLLSPSLIKDIPAVETAARLQSYSDVIKFDNKFFNEGKVFFADSGFLNMFSYDLLEGNGNTSLNEPYAAVISQSTSRKYFGPNSPIGNILYINDTIPIKVTGVYNDLPAHTHLKTNLLISFATFKAMGANLDTWDNSTYYSYVLLRENTSLSNFQTTLNDYVKRNINVLPNKEDYKLEAQNIQDIHLSSHKSMELEPAGSKSSLYIFISIALFVLLIACINYINISTANAVNREKEIGLRKTIGAFAKQIRMQFLTESVLTALFSLCAAILLAILFLPQLNSLTGTDLKIADLLQGRLILFIIVFTFFVGLLAGIYPAVILSRFSPVTNLNKSNFSGKRKINFRYTLVTIQFALSLILVVSSVIIYQQISFMKQQFLGFDKEQVLILPFNWNEKVTKQYEVLKQDLLLKPEVKHVTESGDIPGRMSTTMSYWVEGMPLDKTDGIQALYVDHDFIPTYDMRIAAGRDFSKEITTDNQEAYIINENAAALFGWKNEEAIGKKISVHTDGRIVGVVKNFHFNSLQQSIDPLVMAIRPDWSGYISIRMSSSKIDQTLGFIESTWKKNLPNRSFEHYFLKEDFNRLYQAETRLGTVITIFTTLAFIIAAIGIIGLTIFTIQRRRKEVGIRKVVGASESQIAILFSKEFLKPVFVAMLLAFPITWYIMVKWLQDFAYHIDISVWVFAVAGFISIIVALGSISIQAIKAAMANPVRSLRTE